MTHADEIAAWRQTRHRAITGPTGPLALSRTVWLTAEPQAIDGVPGRWHADGGAVLTATPDDGIAVDGEPAHGEVRLRAVSSEAPSHVRFHLDDAGRALLHEVTATVVSRTDFDGETQIVAIRLWDSRRGERLGFQEIASYPTTGEHVYDAVFEPASEDRVVPFEHIRDAGRTRGLVVPGDIRATIGGEEYTLQAFDDGDRLILVFADATNRDETYASGRFLFVEPAADGRVVLDFNRAFVPPCGFSDQFNCPLPPSSNRFPIRIEAGEKKPVWQTSGAEPAP